MRLLINGGGGGEVLTPLQTMKVYARKVFYFKFMLCTLKNFFQRKSKALKAMYSMKAFTCTTETCFVLSIFLPRSLNRFMPNIQELCN